MFKAYVHICTGIVFSALTLFCLVGNKQKLFEILIRAVQKSHFFEPS